MPKFSTCLWFDDHAEEAAKFYVSVFKGSRIGKIARYGGAAAKASGRREGSVMTVAFKLNGRDFLALNGGPIFKFNEAISLMVLCKTQKEIDYYWNKLSADPKAEQCGWLKDKFGVSWQITPDFFEKMITGPNKAKTERYMQAMMQMKKIDIAALKKAYAGD